MHSSASVSPEVFWDKSVWLDGQHVKSKRPSKISTAVRQVKAPFNYQQAEKRKVQGLLASK